MDEFPTVSETGGALPAQEAASNQSEQKPDGETGGVKPDAKPETAASAQSDTTPAAQATAASDTLVRERDEALAKVREYESRLAAQAQPVITPVAQVQPQQDATPARDYDAELADLDKKLEEGDISIGEFQAAQRGILASQYQEVAQRTVSEQLQRHTQAVTAKQIEAAFLQENPDFEDFRKSQKLSELQTSKPWGGIHDEVSAYFAHKWQSEVAGKDAAIQAAVAKATKETEDRLRAEFRAKGGALTLGGGPTSVPPAEKGVPLSDGRGKGSLVARIAERHAQRVAARNT